MVDPFAPDPSFQPLRHRTPRWPFVLVGLFLLVGAAVLALWPVKLPYYAIAPGPVEEVADLISVQDVPVYATNGDLFLLTVGLREVNLFEYVEAELDPRVDLWGRDAVRPAGVTQEQQTRSNLEAMDQSIDTAIYVALTRLGYEVGFTGEGVTVLEVVAGTFADGVLQAGDVITHIDGVPVLTSDDASSEIRLHTSGETLQFVGSRDGQPLNAAIAIEGITVLQVVAGTPAEGALQVGDVITEVDGKAVQTSEEASDEIRAHAIGDTIEVAGTRRGESFRVPVTLVAHPDLQGVPMVGVVLDMVGAVFDTLNLGLDLPIDVEVDSRNIGGPSAGMMYAIAVLDLLTEEDLAKGHRIAGTGTISFDEMVGAIGGVRQKVYAARSVGAEYVLVPADNYDEALTAAGKDIQVVAVATLQDALDFLDSLEPAAGTVAAS